MPQTETYFYQFLEPFNRELAHVARELEFSIFSSPRTMLTHSRTFADTLLQHVMQIEGVPNEERVTLKDRMDMLNEKGYLTPEARDALHAVRMIGNEAAHQTRAFRFRESLQSWENLYTVVKWYVEVYGPVDFSVPEYKDPDSSRDEKYDIAELEVRLRNMEELLLASVQAGAAKESPTATEEPLKAKDSAVLSEEPGFTPIRTITYKEDKLEIPYFLRDAFLLPQRFMDSERFLIRLGAEQQARIMSELPQNLEGLHEYVKRYTDKNVANFFVELKDYVKEEKIRRKIELERPGELFLFFKADYIILTEAIANVPLSPEEFTGIPNLLRQLNEDQIERVGQLPKELVILAKYESVGIGTVEKLFEQIKKKQA
ncbi:MAG TPA: DUF4145 domain-containing protein [Bacillaceae bacterium]